MAMDFEIRVEPVGTGHGKAMKWKWTLLCDGEDVADGETSGAEEKAREAARRAQTANLAQLAKQKTKKETKKNEAS
jgi:hypothetical protein